MAAPVRLEDAETMSAFATERDVLYRAYTSSYSKESQHLSVTRLVDVLLAAAGVVATATDSQSSVLAALALLWLAVREAPWFVRPDHHRRMAIRLQEQFECSFGIEPNAVLTGSPVPDHEVRSIADGSKASLPPDYFVDTSDLDPQIGVVLMQNQTATWGEVDHRKYSTVNYVIAFVAIALLVAWAFVTNRTMQDLVVQILAPAAPFVVGRLQLARRHHQYSDARADLRRRTEEAFDRVQVDPSTWPTSATARAFQDRLFVDRMNEGRIPAWLYKVGAKKGRRTLDVSVTRRANSLRETIGLPARS
jgi:hypothetical protein